MDELSVLIGRAITSCAHAPIGIVIATKANNKAWKVLFILFSFLWLVFINLFNLNHLWFIQELQESEPYSFHCFVCFNSFHSRWVLVRKIDLNSEKNQRKMGRFLGFVTFF